jgi:hypothetical protein
MDVTVDLQNRVVELEQRAARLVLAGDDRDGSGAWHNHLELRFMQERDFNHAVVAEVLGKFHSQIIDECKILVAEKLKQRVRGTFDPEANYVANDLIALNGAAFVAKQDNPGPCPGPGWQLIAAQGKRGVAGERGKDAPRIVGWVVDRAAYTVAPRFSDNSLGPLLELRELFAPSQDDGVV